MDVKIEDSKLANLQLDDDAQINLLTSNPSQPISNLPDNQNQNLVRLFSSLFMDQINLQDVNAILDSQQQIIKRLDYTNKNLLKTNKLSSETYNSFGVKDYQSYISLLNAMKSDLEFIFKRIKTMKTKLSTKYPVEYQNAIKKVHQNKKYPDSDDEEEELNTSNIQSKQVQEQIKLNQADLIEESNFKSVQNTTKLNERSMSIGSTSSTTSTSAIVANLLQTAKNRLSASGKEMVNGFFNSTNNTQNSSINNARVPTPVLSPYLSNKLENEVSESSKNANDTN